jgi:hypothetical protein
MHTAGAALVAYAAVDDRRQTLLLPPTTPKTRQRLDQIKRITCEEETAEAPIPMCTAQLQMRISCRLHRQARSLALHAIARRVSQRARDHPAAACGVPRRACCKLEPAAGGLTSRDAQ